MSARSLFIHTHDVSRSLKPSSDGELAHAIHQTLHFALDGHPDDWGLHHHPPYGGCGTPEEAEGEARPGFFPTSDIERPYVSYAWDGRSGTLSLPNPCTITNPVADPCSPAIREAYDVTAKFFFLDQIQPHFIDDALQRLTSTTGLITLDTLVVAFPALDLEEPTDEVVGKVKEIWGHVSQNPQFLSLGVADISKGTMERLFEPLNQTRSPGYSVPSQSRKPKVVSINPASGFDRSLSSWCEGQRIQLIAHSDRKDVLPDHTLPGLLAEFDGQLPYSLPIGKLRPKWTLKYTTLIRDRGVLADKG